MKVLVAIANYGMGNRQYLDILLQEYRSMDFNVDIVILSNIPKDLGPDVEVVVGLPSSDPRSLPFAHKRVFGERCDEFDVFIFSEDDTLIRQENIEAFLAVTEVLPSDEIAGFLRFEEDAEGNRYCSSVHSHFHWVPDSVHSIDQYTFAHFTNPHSACYILTQTQLKKAIRSGGFLVAPYNREPHTKLVTAATDPYTQCGFERVVCISHFRDFLLHHLPNKYIGKMGLDENELILQIKTLFSSQHDPSLRKQLLEESSIEGKNYYEEYREDILSLVPNHSKKVLSVGCGWGATEAMLVGRGIHVVGIPMDRVIGECARLRGVEIVSPDFHEAVKILSNQLFDCIIFSDILPRVRNPAELVGNYATLLADGGLVIVSSANRRNISTLKSRLQGIGFCDAITEWYQTPSTTKELETSLLQGGLRAVEVVHRFRPRFRWPSKIALGMLNNLLAMEIVMAGQRR